MTKLGSQKLHICPKGAKMGSINGHRIDYNGIGALRDQRHIPSKNLPKCPPWEKCKGKKGDRGLGIWRFPVSFSHGIYPPTAPSSFIFTNVQANFEAEKIYDGSAKERKHIGKSKKKNKLEEQSNMGV